MKLSQQDAGQRNQTIRTSFYCITLHKKYRQKDIHVAPNKLTAL